MKNIQTNQYFYRSILEKLKKWIDRKEIFIIKGPRQSGKTTILKILKDWLISEKNVKEKNIIFITFEERDILDKFSLDPKEYIKSFIGNKNNEKLYFFIDEFQYLKNSGQILKMLYDIFENIKFIITGSSSLELTDKTDKFLVGRVFSFYLWQLNFEEFVKIKSEQLYNVYKEKTTHINNFIIHNKNFSFAKKDIFESDFEKLFQEYIIYGGYPEVVKSYDRETKKVILKNIYNTYITKDIIELLKITDYSKFKILVSILSAQIGNIINYNNLSQDTQIYFKELKRYLSILEETYIISFLTPFFTNKISELKKNPKIYFIDIGLRNYISSMLNDNIISRSDLGAIVENTIFCQLKLKEKEEDLYLVKYWRTSGRAEIDFILQKSKQMIPIEVKYSLFNSPKISRGFRNFIKEYKPEKALVLTKNYYDEIKINSTLVKFAPLWYL